MTSLVSFPQFANLPAELRLKIWEEVSVGPAMHAFDVCLPSRRGRDRSRRAFEAPDGTISKTISQRWTKYNQTIFLDALEVGHPDPGRETHVAWHAHDPSMYKQRQMQRQVSVEAASAVAGDAATTNTVYLPSRERRIEYNNDRDVLILRLWDGDRAMERSPGVLFAEQHHDNSSVSSIADLLEEPWSAEMASTLHNAHRIALDVAEMWTSAPAGAISSEETAYLGCCLQQGLEVLYLVDHCAGRCIGCGKHGLKAADLRVRGELYKQLHILSLDEEMVRDPDEIQGVGKAYREIFNLERLGWDDLHPSYIFATMIEEAIRSQQTDANAKVFKGVRVLMMEDEVIPGVDTRTFVDCRRYDMATNAEGMGWSTTL